MIQIPPKATKIKILGFTFYNAETDLNFEKQHYKIEADYYNSEYYETKSDDLNITGVKLNDTVFLNEPILFLIIPFSLIFL